jgi:dUTP pyrophosphatase
MTEDITIKLQLMDHAKGLNIPHYASDGAAGMDIEAAVGDPAILGPMQRAAIPTGLMMAIPQGYEVQIRPRSGLALKHGLTVANAPGTIDSDYRGEVQIILVNLGTKEVTITRGMRIAQMVLAPVTKGRFVTVDKLDKTTRGMDGFGSTGA